MPSNHHTATTHKKVKSFKISFLSAQFCMRQKPVAASTAVAEEEKKSCYFGTARHAPTTLEVGVFRALSGEIVSLQRASEIQQKAMPRPAFTKPDSNKQLFPLP